MSTAARRSSVVVVALMLTLSGACTSDAEGTDPASLADVFDVQPSIELGCEGTSTADPPGDFEVVSGVVALPASPNHAALQTSRRETDDGSTYFFAKTGLVWNAASSFELVVPDALRSRMAIGWGGPAPPSHATAVNCDGAEGWVALPGGYWVTEPLCADLVVRTEAEEATVQIGLGVPCDGQEPPSGPSDA